jgi:hypothetical protein
MLVTGFETYCGERFVEIEGEGVPCDATAVLSRLGIREEREAIKAGQVPRRSLRPRLAEKSPVPEIASRINFQSYDSCKRAYNAGYGLKFGEDLGVSGQLLERVQRLLLYRHRVVHGSPIAGMLNQPEAPPEELEFSNRAFAEGAQSAMDEFIRALHTATLGLRG